MLQNNAKYQVVPKKLTIGKRLAQCLHPALPSGVHRKALETYEIIFKIIGPKRLAKDLFLYRYSRPDRPSKSLYRVSTYRLAGQLHSQMYCNIAVLAVNSMLFSTSGYTGRSQRVFV